MEGDFTVAQGVNHGCANAGDVRLQAGSAILVRGTVVGTRKYAFDGDDRLSEDLPVPDLDGRVVGCVTARLTGTTKDAKICTTHLAKEEAGLSPPWAQARVQTRKLARFFAAETRSMPFVLTGDLNIPTPPADDALATLYAGDLGSGDFREAWEERACGGGGGCAPEQGGPATHASNRKLDYVFADRRHFVVPVGRASIDTDRGKCGEAQRDCSDHHLSYAELLMAR